MLCEESHEFFRLLAIRLIMLAIVNAIGRGDAGPMIKTQWLFGQQLFQRRQKREDIGLPGSVAH